MTNYYIFHGDTFYSTTKTVAMDTGYLLDTYMYSDWAVCWSRFYQPKHCSPNWYWVETHDVPKEYRAKLLLLT